MPKLSIITINYNNVGGLEKTIESVINQTFKEFEYIIIDGGSTDGSTEVIEKYTNHFAYWVSEADAGIYNAMNKGIEVATGEYLLFLNSGDRMYNSSVLTKIRAQLTTDIVYGDLEFVGHDGTWIMQPPALLNFEYFMKKSLPHPATLIKRELFLKYGSYNTKMRICSDWAFFLDAIFLHNATYKYVQLTFSSFMTDGVSSVAENWPQIEAEKSNYLTNNYFAFVADYKNNEATIAKYNALKNSRVRKFLSLFFKQLKID